MAISIQPVDGLINRLLQQNSKPTAVAKQNSSAPIARYDQINISSSAHGQPAAQTEQSGQQQAQAQQQTQQKPGERALESHLLNLYKKNDHLGG